MGDRSEYIFSRMRRLLEELLASPCLTRNQVMRGRRQSRNIPEEGIYVFYDNDEPLYVVRSGSKTAKLHERILEHGNKDSHGTSGTSVRMLALEIAHPNDRGWESIYKKERERIQDMGVRIVKVTDQYEGYMFEVYAAYALNTPYNTFETS